MQTLTLNIGGMTCGGCVKSVTRILESTEGVIKAEVSLKTKMPPSNSTRRKPMPPR